MPSNCDLLLEVYEDDGETLAWEVGTAADHSYPYLQQLTSQYATQELDIANGAASIGTCSVTVIDVPQTPGDQDSGFMTEKLADLGLAALAGRRCRLRRWNGAAWVRVADGPASAPRLDSTFASYTWDIKDTRENERRLRAFAEASTKTSLPEGVLDGYGYDDETDTYLLNPARTNPIIGLVEDNIPSAPLYPDSRVVRISGFNTTALRTISRAAWQSVTGNIVYGDPVLLDDNHGNVGYAWEYHTTFNRRVRVLWRESGSSDPWTELRDTLEIHGGVFFDPIDPGLPDPLPDKPPDGPGGLLIGLPSGDEFVITEVLLGDNAPGSPNLPDIGLEIELIVIPVAAPGKSNPVHVEGVPSTALPAGLFAQQAYDGLYSIPDENGDPVPTGIQYDAAALDAITTPVRIRLTEPIKDVRDWLEKNVYAPTGYVPALDADGRISPVSQVPPASTAGLPVVNADNATPSPDWDAGELIYNIIRITYPRDFVPSADATPDTGDGLSEQEVIVEFQDPASVARFGNQVLELDGQAFRALGTGTTGDPIRLLEDETGYQLCEAKAQYMLARYSLGAPAVQLMLIASEFASLRAGDWVLADLSWLPDYVTGRRGLLALCQVVALGENDCGWRAATLEVVPPGIS